jgi:hypothetical protein
MAGQGTNVFSIGAMLLEYSLELKPLGLGLHQTRVKTEKKPTRSAVILILILGVRVICCNMNPNSLGVTALGGSSVSWILILGRPAVVWILFLGVTAFGNFPVVWSHITAFQK